MSWRRGYALGFYGFGRYTKDFDIWLLPSKTNAKAALRSLRDFGVAPGGLSEQDLSRPEVIVMIGREPCRIDFLMGPSGGVFNSAWRRRVTHVRGGVAINFVGLDDLIALKKAAGRDVDKRDVEALLVAQHVRDEPETAPRLPKEVGQAGTPARPRRAVRSTRTGVSRMTTKRKSKKS